MLQTSVDSQHEIQPQCGYSSGSSAASVTSFDLAPFVSTQFNRMEKKSFAEYLKEIETEIKQQVCEIASPIS